MGKAARKERQEFNRKYRPANKKYKTIDVATHNERYVAESMMFTKAIDEGICMAGSSAAPTA